MSPTAYYLVCFEPFDKRIAVSSGTDLREAACRAGIELMSACGGQSDCGQCRVRILDGQVSPLTEDEEDNLTEVEVLTGYRLACHACVHSPVRVHIPRSSLTPAPRH